MLTWLLRRLVILIVTLLGITLLTFLLTRLTPGDPASMRLQGNMATGAYDQLIELNRRNLGLDKPWFINLDFASPEDRVQRALGDHLRESEFWRRDGERRVLRYGGMAVGPLLDRLEALATDDPLPILDSQNRPASDAVSAELQRERLLALVSRLAVHSTTATVELGLAETVAWWRDWHGENLVPIQNPTVAAAAVEEYLRAPEEERDALLQRLRRIGGHSIDPAVRALAKDEDVPRAASILETLTGLSFQGDDLGEKRTRWRNWWRRERENFVAAGTLERSTRIFTDTQWGVWFGQAIRFDFGESFSTRRPVRAMVAEALPVSLTLAGLSIFFSYLLAIPIGVFSALKRHSPADRVITLILFILYSLPSFWVAGIFILTLTGPPFLTLFPTRGMASPDLQLADNWSNIVPVLLDRAWHLVLPVICLTYGSLAFISRQMRSAMLETISSDFIRTAVAKGASSRAVIWKHAFRNSLLPIITISAGILPELVAGAIIIESIFTIPGMGDLTFRAILNRDYPVINAVLFLSAFLTLLGILLADLAYSIADPRIDYR
jgi:peptide/nickel transport system permease protein